MSVTKPGYSMNANNLKKVTQQNAIGRDKNIMSKLVTLAHVNKQAITCLTSQVLPRTRAVTKHHWPPLTLPLFASNSTPHGECDWNSFQAVTCAECICSPMFRSCILSSINMSQT